MMVDVVMCDGRTTFRFSNRGTYIVLVTRDPKKLGSERPLPCWARYRDNPDVWVPRRLLYVRSNSVSYAEQVPLEQRDEFLYTNDPEQLARVRAKEASRENEAEEPA